jgi:hypothetical protein
MNIKTTLVLAATALSLLSTQAFAFRDMGDAGGNSAFAIPERHSDSGVRNGGWYVRPGVYASAPTTQVHRPIHRQNRAGQR